MRGGCWRAKRGAEEVGEGWYHWWEPKAGSFFCKVGKGSVKWRREFGERQGGFIINKVILGVAA